MEPSPFGELAMTAATIGVGAYEGYKYFSQPRDQAKTVERSTNFDNKQNTIYYHYSNQKGYNGIVASNYTILPNSRGQVYLTTYPMSSEMTKNSLFMGGYGSYRDKGDYVVSFTLNKGVMLSPGTQPNELIHSGTLRYGRQIDKIIYSGINPF